MVLPECHLVQIRTHNLRTIVRSALGHNPDDNERPVKRCHHNIKDGYLDLFPDEWNGNVAKLLPLVCAFNVCRFVIGNGNALDRRDEENHIKSDTRPYRRRQQHPDRMMREAEPCNGHLVFSE